MTTDLKKMQVSKKRWPDIQKMLLKKSSKIVLLEVPKGTNLGDSDLIEKLDLGERIIKAAKSKTKKDLVKVKIADNS